MTLIALPVGVRRDPSENKVRFWRVEKFHSVLYLHSFPPSRSFSSALRVPTLGTLLSREAMVKGMRAHSCQMRQCAVQLHS